MIDHPASDQRESLEADARLDAGLSVRAATMADLAVVVELRLALLREHADNPIYRRLRPDAPARASRLFAAQLRCESEVIFLAESDGGPVGILRVVASAGLPLLFPAKHGYISSVYVVPSARRHGVLRALFTAAMGWCRERGLREVRLHNAVENETANAVWDALGFRVVEHLRVCHLS
ncbi:MAG TPA: GNAT family N-acetyltransferase [Gemmatimonadaceae bacterium]|nr:GNAT family N-acetyltransferase [Gemmatimonadaceae bacterium]